MKKIILDLCGGTGSWSKPYADTGYRVFNITLPEFDVTQTAILSDELVFFPPKGSNRPKLRIHIKNIVGILAAPPCTEFSIAKDHQLKRDFEKGMEVVRACLKIIYAVRPKFWAVENPVGYLRAFLGKPVFSFQPWWFGDSWSKRTMLWGEFNRPKQKYKKFTESPEIEGLYIRPGRKVPSIAFMHKSHKKLMKSLTPFEVKSDAEFRAITPPGFAQAFFKTNQ